MNDKCEAIAWLANIKEKYIHGGDEEFDECRRESIDMAIKALRQPQIVRCKDCAYALYKEGVVKPGHIVCTKPFTERWQVVKLNDWFCADGERG